MTAVDPTADASVAWAKDQARQVYLWNLAESQRVLRAATAKGFGFDPLVFDRPFPGSPPNQVTIVNQDQPPPGMQATTAPAAVAAQAVQTAQAVAPTLLQRVAPWALLVAGLFGTGGVGTLAGLLMSSRPAAVVAPVSVQPVAVQPVAPVVQPAPAATPAVKPVELEIDYKMGPDGKWSIVPKQVTPGS